MKDNAMSRVQKGLCLCAMALLPLAQAEDLPWKFEGDTHRDADVRVASLATEFSSFASSIWASEGTWLLSTHPGFLLFLH